MKKILSLFVLTITVLAVLMTACSGKSNGDDVYRNITAQSNPYSMGKQSIELVASSSAVVNDEPTAKFKKSISASDIELGQALEGKEVTKVVYNSESSVTVTLDGNTKVPGATGGNSVYGTITVKQSGMKSKGSSTCIVNVIAPAMVISSFSGGGGGNKYSVSAKIKLTAGEFTSAATAENIAFADDATGELRVTLSDGLLEVNVENCTVANPTIVFGVEVTSFGKEYSIKLAQFASTLL